MQGLRVGADATGRGHLSQGPPVGLLRHHSGAQDLAQRAGAAVDPEQRALRAAAVLRAQDGTRRVQSPLPRILQCAR